MKTKCRLNPSIANELREALIVVLIVLVPLAILIALSIVIGYALVHLGIFIPELSEPKTAAEYYANTGFIVIVSAMVIAIVSLIIFPELKNTKKLLGKVIICEDKKDEE